MDIVFVTHFGDDYSISDNDRFLYLAKMLYKKHDVEIITSNFRHTSKTHRNSPAYEYPFKITFIKEPGYRKNVSLKRFYSHFFWGRKVGKYLQNRKKPDVVYCAIPSLTGPNLIAKYCEKNHIRFIIDVQDLWPEAFQMIFNIPIIKDVIFYPFKALADGIYKRADGIVAVSETYMNRALKVNKKCAEGHAVFLGTDLSVFDENAKQEIGIHKEEDEIWLGYCGTLGSSYDITCVIDALKIIKDEGEKTPTFIIMGDGPKQKEFEDYAAEKGIGAKFLGRLPYNKMCSLLKQCDIAVNPIVGKAAQSIINKHADYAACGLPVINTQESEEYRKLVEKYHMGYNCRNNDALEVAEKIKIMVGNKNKRVQMGMNARICAKELFDRRKICVEIIDVIIGEKKLENC